MKEKVKELIKRYSITGLGLIIGLTIVDLVKGEGFQLDTFMIRIIVAVVLYTIFGFVEYKSQKNKEGK
ncbi:MAG: hypothetical protein J6A77_07350 [Lachnospiraceae bacterium]|nr:hypothetical protein [Lachnospiraceae bacterium]